MTTVAFKDGVMACDSRITGGPISASKTKIIKGRDCLVGFCGDGFAAYNGALWLARETQYKPETKDDDESLYLLWRDKTLYYVDQYFRELPITDKFASIGSGEMAAMAAMAMGATAPEAVKIAIKYDEGSGGKVLTFSLDE